VGRKTGAVRQDEPRPREKERGLIAKGGRHRMPERKRGQPTCIGQHLPAARGGVGDLCRGGRKEDNPLWRPTHLSQKKKKGVLVLAGAHKEGTALNTCLRPQVPVGGKDGKAAVAYSCWERTKKFPCIGDALLFQVSVKKKKRGSTASTV